MGPGMEAYIFLFLSEIGL
jgi:hypothetical protein